MTLSLISFKILETDIEKYWHFHTVSNIFSMCIKKSWNWFSFVMQTSFTSFNFFLDLTCWKCVGLVLNRTWMDRIWQGESIFSKTRIWIWNGSFLFCLSRWSHNISFSRISFHTVWNLWDFTHFTLAKKKKSIELEVKRFHGIF